jgi:pseudouridine-5'-phosphate glycosidase
MREVERIRIASHVAAALTNGEPVVGLESTVLAHGLPIPLNLETARACEEAVRRQSATPATVGIVDGSPVIGLTDDELELFARGDAPLGSRIEKVGLNNLAGIILRRGWGATTVAATMQIADAGGIRVFATGGIGGVHRGAADSFDVSADLTALSRIPLICVCAGAKAILDLPKTVEQLETLGVPIVGYQTEEFPAFYSRSSGLGVDITVESPRDVAELAWHHWRSGLAAALLVCVRVPVEFELPADEIEQATEAAVEMAAQMGIRGKELTPFLLAQMEKLSGGKTLQANRALLINNATVAAQIAKEVSGTRGQGVRGEKR